MPALTRQQVLNVLQEDWGSYVQRFHSLPPQAQAAFLEAQGYARLADLLAHILAWWEVGFQSIKRYLDDPQARPGEYEVDAFNAAAVAKVGGLSEESVVASFEAMRADLCDFVQSLPAAAFENAQVLSQLNMELIGHLHDHDLPS